MKLKSILLSEKDRKDWEGELLSLVFKEYNFGLQFLAVIFIVGILISFYFNLFYKTKNDEIIKSILLIFNILYILLFKKANSSKIDWHLLLISIILIGVIEIIIDNTEKKYTDPSNWIILPILMLYHAFYFKNIPKYFAIYWFLIFSYFYMRLFRLADEFILHHNLNGMFLYILPFYIFSCGFNFLLLRNRYTNLLYIKNLDIETSKRIEIEKELAIQKTTNLMVSEIHEQIGFAILDFKSTLTDVVNDISYNEVALKEIYTSILTAEDALKINIYSLSDMNLLEEDFFIGIKNILISRYEIFHRNVNVFNSKLSSSDFLEFTDPKIVRQIFLICREICSNDLKYGFGISDWNWLYEETLTLKINCSTLYNNKNYGKGTKSIMTRVNFLKGNLFYKNENDIFSCTIEFPFKKI